MTLPSIYDDPEINTPGQGFADQVRFEQVGARVRGRILSIDKITTRYGPTLKYLLLDETGKERSMIGGSVNLKGQLLELRPEVGDVLDVELIELRNTANGTAKIFDIQVEEGDKQSLRPSPPNNNAAQRKPRVAAAPLRQTTLDDEESLFDE